MDAQQKAELAELVRKQQEADRKLAAAREESARREDAKRNAKK